MTIAGHIAAIRDVISKDTPARIILITDGEDDTSLQLCLTQRLVKERILLDAIVIPNSRDEQKYSPIRAMCRSTSGIAVLPDSPLITQESFADLFMRRIVFPVCRLSRGTLDILQKNSNYPTEIPAVPVRRRPVGDVPFRTARIGKELKICQIHGRRITALSDSEFGVLVFDSDALAWFVKVYFPWNYPYNRPIFRIAGWKWLAQPDLVLGNSGRVPDSRLGKFQIGERLEILLGRVSAELKLGEREGLAICQVSFCGLTEPEISQGTLVPVPLELWKVYERDLIAQMAFDRKEVEKYHRKIAEQKSKE
jgi:hypothetical protein